MDTSKLQLTHKDVHRAAAKLAVGLAAEGRPLRLYAVPRGGVPAAYALGAALNSMETQWELVDTPKQATHIVDDLIDSGATQELHTCYGKQFVTLFVKQNSAGHLAKTRGDADGYVYFGTMLENKWLVFPWEAGEEVAGVEHNITRLLQYVGEDPKRGGLLETPKRVAKAWADWTVGYGQDPKDVLKVFEDGAENYDQMIVVRDLPFYTHCEHHMAPFFGTATIGYIPNGKIVGLSKLSRVLEIFARRLQVQERLTNQVADALNDNLDPLGVGVIIKARHLCMESRGVCQQGHHTLTSALRGVMREQAETRNEFLQLSR